ncbi:hypothetical protein FOL47_003024 [Perkinsus chesapeaki]|uniref:Uncharacterized protein n=1 Tax=Perkinsus chesapeaki TaxID=330153 RepID=A0A7J6MA16_PERCH|nr:hypothetical protein FOL47_003024 [Perkinsus chesapeaki]
MIFTHFFQEVCGPFLHSTHRERFGTPWPPPTRLLAVEDHKENGSPSVVAVSPSPDEGTSPTPSVDVSINNKRKSAEEMSESPAHPPVKRARHAPGVPRHVERMLRMLHQAADASTRSPYAPSAESPSPSESSGDEASEEEVSQCDKYMDRVLQDDDPENGIEEEYRCYNNKIFQWQLRRMLARSHIECYYRRTPPASNDAAKEELINLVYKLKGKDKPNTTVTAAPEEEPPVAAAS